MQTCLIGTLIVKVMMSRARGVGTIEIFHLEVQKRLTLLVVGRAHAGPQELRRPTKKRGQTASHEQVSKD